MFLFRIAIVLALIIAVMPADKEQQERLYGQVATAAHWTQTFCDRNARTCENAAVMWDAFLRKAEFAGRLVDDLAQRYVTQTPDPYAPAFYGAPDAPARGTLTFEDLQPKWRGESRRRGI
jgi:hypothetical protein